MDNPRSPVWIFMMIVFLAAGIVRVTGSTLDELYGGMTEIELRFSVAVGVVCLFAGGVMFLFTVFDLLNERKMKAMRASAQVEKQESKSPAVAQQPPIQQPDLDRHYGI